MFRILKVLHNVYLAPYRCIWHIASTLPMHTLSIMGLPMYGYHNWTEFNLEVRSPFPFIRNHVKSGNFISIRRLQYVKLRFVYSIYFDSLHRCLTKMAPALFLRHFTFPVTIFSRPSSTFSWRFTFLISFHSQRRKPNLRQTLLQRQLATCHKLIHHLHTHLEATKPVISRAVALLQENAYISTTDYVIPPCCQSKSSHQCHGLLLFLKQLYGYVHNLAGS